MKKSITSILFAVAALATTTAVANVTTNVFTNVTYRSRISYSLAPVTNSVMKPVLERNGATSLTSTNTEVLCVSCAPIDTNKLDTTKEYVWASRIAYTNVSGSLGIYANIGKFHYSGGEWNESVADHVFETEVAYTNMNDVAVVVSGDFSFEDSDVKLVDDAGVRQRVWGTNGLHTVTNVAKKIVYKPDFEISQMLVPSISYITVTNVYTNIFVNGINVTR